MKAHMPTLMSVAMLQLTGVDKNPAGSSATDDVGLWTGTVVVEATVHESGGWHPCKTTIRVRLREAGET